MSRLAIHGGSKVRTKLFPGYNPIGDEEISSVIDTMKTGKLSNFIGGWHKCHYGGDKVLEFENAWSEMIGTKYGVSVNSATSGLIAAMGAIGIEPGDEVIVTPYSMCISATAPLFYGGIPVFADLDPNTWSLSPEGIKKKITKKTKAIIIVDIFGQTYHYDEIRQIACENNLIVIEDASQAPLAEYKGKKAGTLGDIAIFSFNYHKHIHCGEGGIVVTDSEEYADRLQLIRNHAEAVVDGKGTENPVNMLGYNMRMGEIEASILLEQMKKMKGLIEERIDNVKYFSHRISELPFIELYKEHSDSKHVYYKMVMKYDQSITGIHRNIFLDAVRAELTPFELREDEGVNLSAGYLKPLYLLPIFQNKIAIGGKGFPFNTTKGHLNYDKGCCPVVEDAFYNSLVCHEFIHSSMSKNDMDDVIRAFEKVWEYRRDL